MLKNLDFLTNGKSWPPADKGDIDRQAQYRENSLLREGKFEEVWPDLYKYLRKGETAKGVEFCLDYPDLITTKTCDLIIGEPPSFNVPDIEVETQEPQKPKPETIETETESEEESEGKPALEGEAETEPEESEPEEVEEEIEEELENPDEDILKEFVDRVGILEVLDALITNVDSLGDGVLKLIKDENDEVKILNINPANWFPIVERGTEEIQYHVLAFKYRDGDSCYLEIEIHSKEFIEHRIYKLNESSSGLSATIGEHLDWNLYHPDILEVEENPTGEFLVLTCHNKNDGIFGRSSYKPSLKSILKKLIIRFALEHDVLDTFMRPTFFGPKEYTEIDPITKKPAFRPGGYIGVNADPHTMPVTPGALTWDAHLGENEVSKESLMKQLFNMSEMSPVLFAGFSVGLAPSGTALRLLLTNTLAKCSRIRRKVDKTARDAINLGLLLEDTPIEGLYIEWQDGLPTIPLEEAQEYNLLLPVLGQKGCLKQMGYTEAEANQMVEDTQNQGMML